jgi:hypothetical protein
MYLSSTCRITSHLLTAYPHILINFVTQILLENKAQIMKTSTLQSCTCRVLSFPLRPDDLFALNLYVIPVVWNTDHTRINQHSHRVCMLKFVLATKITQQVKWLN